MVVLARAVDRNGHTPEINKDPGGLAENLKRDKMHSQHPKLTSQEHLL
jgi:hypothetical protein